MDFDDTPIEEMLRTIAGGASFHIPRSWRAALNAAADVLEGRNEEVSAVSMADEVAVLRAYKATRERQDEALREEHRRLERADREPRNYLGFPRHEEACEGCRGRGWVPDRPVPDGYLTSRSSEMSTTYVQPLFYMLQCPDAGKDVT